MRRASSGWLSSARYGPPKPSPCALRRAAIFSKSARASAGSVAGFISSSVIEQLLFVIGPGARAGALGGGDVGSRRVGAPVVPGAGAVRAGIDEDDAVAGERLAQRGDRRGRMDGRGRSARVLD